MANDSSTSTQGHGELGDNAELIRQALGIPGGHLSVGRYGYTLHYARGCTLSGYDPDRLKAACLATGLPVIDTCPAPIQHVAELTHLLIVHHDLRLGNGLTAHPSLPDLSLYRRGARGAAQCRGDATPATRAPRRDAPTADGVAVRTASGDGGPRPIPRPTARRSDRHDHDAEHPASPLRWPPLGNDAAILTGRPLAAIGAGVQRPIALARVVPRRRRDRRARPQLRTDHPGSRADLRRVVLGLAPDQAAAPRAAPHAPPRDRHLMNASDHLDGDHAPDRPQYARQPGRRRPRCECLAATAGPDRSGRGWGPGWPPVPNPRPSARCRGWAERGGEARPGDDGHGCRAACGIGRRKGAARRVRAAPSRGSASPSPRPPRSGRGEGR